MTVDLIIIFGGLVFAIGIIVLIAFVFQQWLVEQQFKSHTVYPSKELQEPRFPEFSEKLRARLGIEVPTYEIRAKLQIPNSDDVIVLLKFHKGFQNLFRCRSDGSLIWQAESVEKPSGSYLDIQWKNDYLIAYSESGFSAVLDSSTGKILSSEFVK